VVGVVIFREAVTNGEWFAFVMVWVAVAIYTIDTMRTGASIPRAQHAK
jgi:EamA domain-containing membrane protein RarD